MDPEDSPELPPLKRGTYDLDAILAAAESAEFAIPPPATRTSFNANPFASSSPSAFRSNFNSSSVPSINNSPYPTSSTGEDEFPTPPPERPQPVPRKPLTPTTTRKRVSTLKSTLSKFSVPKKTDLEPAIVETATADDPDITAFDQGGINTHYNSHTGSSNNDGVAAVTGADNDDLSFEGRGTPMHSLDGNNSSGGGDGGRATSPASSIGSGRRSRPLRTAAPFNRVASPVASGSHLEAATSSPSRASSPINVSSNSIGAGNDLAVYSTPSSSRPTSRPTSRPNSRVSNGRYHSRQLSSDSLVSFNNMVDKEDLEHDALNHSGHVSFVVSDPEHLRILEGEIEDPFSPSMSSIDPDTDAYLSNLMQQSTSPFSSLKSNSRGQSPAFKSRRQRQAESGSGGADESFMDSTDDALSDKELNPKFRTSRTGTRTPSSPLARAVTRVSPRQHGDNMVVGALANAGVQLSLDQILRDGEGLEGLHSDQEPSQDAPLSILVSQPTGQYDGSLPPSLSQDSMGAAFDNQDHLGFDDGTNLSPHSPVSQPGSPGHQAGEGSRQLNLDGENQNELEKRGLADIEHVEVDIVVQNVNVHDTPSSRKNSLTNKDDHMRIHYSDIDDDDVDDTPFNQSGTDVLANEEMHLHESLDIHESHAQSFAEWMSSSAEISRLDISPPMGSGYQMLPSFGGMLTSTPLSASEATLPPQGTSLLSSNLGDANVLTSSYTPALSSPEAASATSPNAAKRTTLLEKRSTLLEDLLAKARERTKHKTEASQLLSASVEKEKSMVTSTLTTTESTSATPLSSSGESVETGSSSAGATGAATGAHSVSFATVDDFKVVENILDELDSTEVDAANMSMSAGGADKKGSGLVRRPSGVMLSSRIRDSTNLDAPRYSIREMEDMKKNVRMDLRIEITNEIREEYERSAEQEAAMFQFEIEELKTALEKEKREKEQLKGVLDEFESSLADIAVSTATEIQTIKEQNRKLSESKEETEEAFVLLKTRYDELKDLNFKHVANEGILRKAIETLKQDFETSESRYESLKGHADAKLLQASQEMEQARIVYDNEIAMLKGQLGRQEMQMRTLEQALDIKNKENEDLILFSEELISKLS